MSETTLTSADRELKARQRAMWASGDYPKLSAELLSQLGVVLVEACGVAGGQRVLDVAAGAGNAAIPAAEAGADVVAFDLAPELFDAGRRHAAERGVELEWVEADAEALPFATDEFDVVVSCIGAMFAPRHQQAADELIRVCRPGGVIGMINWTPAGSVGQMFATMAPYAPPPPPSAQPPLLWGTEEHVRQLFGDRVTELVARRQTIAFDQFATLAEYLEYLKTYFGPIIATYRVNADNAERTAALDRDLLEFAARWDEGGGDAGALFHAEYLLVTARKTVQVPVAVVSE
ncbi:MAG: class I SAM-dependent methyltransferase [Pseudonocardiaceae bacterium]